MKRLLTSLTIIIALAGCQPPRQIIEETPPPPPPVSKEVSPDITLTFASIDMSQFRKKIELGDIQKFARQLKSDSIDILSMRGITRYPDLKSRADIVESLAKEADMRKSFGETINLGGRQSGNAVFSVYPIRSSENLQFTGIKSTGFEAAMQTIVDCGARTIIVVSTHITEKASHEDISRIVNSVGKLPETFEGYPIILSGNFEPGRIGERFAPVDSGNAGKMETWYRADGSLNTLSRKTARSVFGDMHLTKFGIFARQRP